MASFVFSDAEHLMIRNLCNSVHPDRIAAFLERPVPPNLVQYVELCEVSDKLIRLIIVAETLPQDSPLKELAEQKRKERIIDLFLENLGFEHPIVNVSTLVFGNKLFYKEG